MGVVSGDRLQCITSSSSPVIMYHHIAIIANPLSHSMTSRVMLSTRQAGSVYTDRTSTSGCIVRGSRSYHFKQNEGSCSYHLKQEVICEGLNPACSNGTSMASSEFKHQATVAYTSVTHTHTHTHNICTHTHTHTCMHTYTHAHTHICTRTRRNLYYTFFFTVYY